MNALLPLPERLGVSFALRLVDACRLHRVVAALQQRLADSEPVEELDAVQVLGDLPRRPFGLANLIIRHIELAHDNSLWVVPSNP